MKKIAILGSTGSIGTQTLNVIARHSDKFCVYSLVAFSNYNLLQKQAEKFLPRFCALTNDKFASKLSKNMPQGTTFISGESALVDKQILDADVVVIAISGFAAIQAVICAIKMSKVIAVATKEVLVSAGEIIMPLAKQYGAKIIPIDSEHSAVFQALNFNYQTPFEKLILTASGGPFLDLPKTSFDKITVLDALAHPNWSMGKKITVDSATMMNKGLEVIEAMRLYSCTLDRVEAVIHRQSIIHSMVEFCDGSVMAQMSYPTMEIPIQIALSFPNRLKSNIKNLDFAQLGALTFEKIDTNKFECYKIALECAKAAGCAPCIMNAANEVAVNRFLLGEIGFLDIARHINLVLEKMANKTTCGLDDIIFADSQARRLAMQL